MTNSTHETGKPVRFPDTGSIAEGHARKVSFAVPGDGPPEEVVLCRVAGELFALDSLCPHEGGRLSEGPLMEGRYLHCPLHLYRFEPRHGRCVGIECPPARTFRVHEENGSALVWVHDGARAPHRE